MKNILNILTQDVDKTYINFWVLLIVILSSDVNKVNVKKFSTKNKGVVNILNNHSFGVLNIVHILLNISIII